MYSVVIVNNLSVNYDILEVSDDERACLYTEDNRNKFLDKYPNENLDNKKIFIALRPMNGFAQFLAILNDASIRFIKSDGSVDYDTPINV